MVAIQRQSLKGVAFGQPTRQAAAGSGEQQVTRFERSKEAPSSSFVGPLPRPHLNRLATFNAVGSQQSVNLSVIDFPVFEHKQCEIPQMVIGHPALDLPYRGRGADAVRTA